MTIGSLFSGIGGLEFGLESCGLGPVRWQVENDSFCRSVLARRWPDAARTVYDVRHAGRHNLPRVTVVSAGFPCQPVSLAGARLAQEDARWLWPEAARIIGELGPPYVFLENVPGLLSANGGRAFGDVLGSLASLGYDAEWDCFRASDVGAPHRRERWFLLAYRHGQRKHEPRGGEREVGRRTLDGGQGRGVADALRGSQQRRQPIAVRGSAVSSVAREAGASPDAHSGERAARGAVRGSRARPAGGGLAQPLVGGVSHGLPGGMDERWPAGRGEPQHAWEPPRTGAKIPQRPARLKALGNAVVPAQAARAWRVLFERIGATP